MTQVAQARLDGDRDKDKALIAETMKLIGNSSYGKLITNKEKHHDIIYVNETEIEEEIMENHFYDITELPNGYYEVEKAKQKINLDLLFILVSSFSTTLNFECLSSTMTFWIITYLVKTLKWWKWILIQITLGSVQKM